MFKFLNTVFGIITTWIINIGMISTTISLPIFLYFLFLNLKTEEFVNTLIIGITILLMIKINKELQGGK